MWSPSSVVDLQCECYVCNSLRMRGTDRDGTVTLGCKRLKSSVKWLLKAGEEGREGSRRLGKTRNMEMLLK